MRGKQKFFSSVAASAVVVVFLFSAPTIATAITTNLNAGESINLKTAIDNNMSVWIGDKVFEAFSWDPSAADTDMAASNVNVKALVNDIGISLQFQLPWTVSGDTKDIVFHYSVAVTNSSNLISDLHLAITGTSSGENAYATVGETAYAGEFVTQVGFVQAFVFNGFPEYAESATNLDYAVSKLWISKDMNLQDVGGDTVSVTAIDQTFSQIPEPGTVLLVGLGLLGVVAVNRKRMS